VFCLDVDKISLLNVKMLLLKYIVLDVVVLPIKLFFFFRLVISHLTIHNLIRLCVMT
jgi:hypothetical protein